nr:glutamyl aminopeptidase-like isoform X2 [Leptinotarsa decemlineata]
MAHSVEKLASTLVTRKCTGYKTNKVVSYLCWKSDQIISKQATAAFGISTIALGVENANLRTEVEDLKTTTSLPSTSTPDKMSKYRLPTAVRPLVYDLFLYPNLTTGLFTGKVKVDVQVLSNTDRIILNSNSLTINKVQIDSVVGSYCLDPTHELLTISKADEAGFKIGNATIEIDFSGDMKNRIVGLYTSSYKSASGENRQIATSKFEPTYARQAYPCFDEPNLKAKYKVHLLKPKDSSYIALSNYPVSKTEDYDDNHQLVSFDETVSMSTYLSCFIVSDFTHTETAFENNGKMIPLKVYASPQNLAKTTYAGQVGKKVIEFYIDYFKIPYPLPKLDMVAIPDFVSGAMEHWGLVTYRETALLYTNTTHSTANKQRVATVVAHELAHSWFGNLVTMDWWNDLWLNEGFASYIEYKGVNAAEPTWGMLDQFLVGDLHTVLNLDATLSSHPIVQTVLTPDQISEIFDTISYNKGASILRMLESTVGEANFQEGVKNYLNKFAYSNAVTEDFLTEIQNVVGNKLNVAELMDTFTVQMGYPILTATVSGDNYTFTQKRFLKDPKAEYNESETTYKYKWTVPVTYVTDSGKSTELSLLKHSDEELTITKPKEAKWIKFNHDQVGYYRVNYPLAQWNELISNYHSLNTADRTHLLEESFSIAEADQLSYEIPLNLTKNLEKETDYTPWSVASTKLKVILRYLRGSDSKQETAFKKYIGKICTPAYENFTWNEDNDDGHLKRLARIEVLGLACAVDQENCLTEAQNQFNNWIQSKEPLSQDLRSLVYHYGMKNANESVWESLLEIYKSESDASEKVKLVYGLASVENVTLLNRLIELAKDESIVRGQDFFTVLQYISANPQGTELVWTWVRENWEYLVGRFTLNDRYLGSLIPAITGRFASEEKIIEMKAFFEKYPNAGAGKASRAKALETVQNNIRWLSRYRTVVENWVTTYSS